ncbi:MAG: hypothetical protein EXS15_08275 [Phycisphaerales bacterium]|nr:hypothetical protein [Phycisphaerales bacterium]
MAIVARVRSKRIVWIGAYAVISLILGVWGAYDYWVRIPEHDASYDVYAEIKEVFDLLEKRAQSARLTDAEIAQYELAKSKMASFIGGAPEPIPFYDPPLQLWVYVVGCGAIGFPWCCWTIVQLRRKEFSLDDAGNLTANGVALASANMATIDMSKWMSKSIATVVGINGERIKLDDYMLQDLHLIVGALAHRFEPALWTLEATKVKSAEDEANVNQSAESTGTEST